MGNRLFRKSIATGLASILLTANSFSEPKVKPLDPLKYHSQILADNIIVNPPNPKQFIINIQERHYLDPYDWGNFKNKKELDSLLTNPTKAKEIKEIADYKLDKVYASQLVALNFMNELYIMGNTNIFAEGLFEAPTKKREQNIVNSLLTNLFETGLFTREELTKKSLLTGAARISYLHGQCNLIPSESRINFMNHYNSGKILGFSHPKTRALAEVREDEMLYIALASGEPYPVIFAGFRHGWTDNIEAYNAVNPSNQVGLIEFDANIDIPFRPSK